MHIQTKFFGNEVYTKEDGVNFDARQIVLNSKRSTCSAMIFEALDESQLKIALSFLDNLEELDKIARRELLSSYNEGDSLIRDFINSHFNDYSEEVTTEIYEKLGITEQDDLLFLEHIEIGLIVAYEEATRGVSATLDYNLIWIDETPFTDQILAVNFNDKMELLSISHES